MGIAKTVLWGKFIVNLAARNFSKVQINNSSSFLKKLEKVVGKKGVFDNNREDINKIERCKCTLY